jgi:hypothetical protein
MAYPQSTLEAIVESERSMFFDGEARYGRHFKHARAATMYLSLSVAGVDRDRSDIFWRFFSLMKKHHTLAFLSALRLHRVQAMLNLRQVLESGACAACAIADPDVRWFADIDTFGVMNPSKTYGPPRLQGGLSRLAADPVCINVSGLEELPPAMMEIRTLRSS